MIDWITIIVSLLSGGALVSLLTIPSAVRRARAEAVGQEVMNAQTVIQGWENLANEHQEHAAEVQARNEELNQKIDELYKENGLWRDRYNDLQEQLSALRVEAATNAVRLCQRRNCNDRTPPTGF